MCGEDFHLEADYEDRVGNFYPYGDDPDDYDDYDEEDETDNEDEPGEIRYFEQYATSQSM